MLSIIKNKISKMDTEKLIKLKRRNGRVFFIGLPVSTVLLLAIMYIAKKSVIVIFVCILLFILIFLFFDFFWTFGIYMIHIELKEREEKAEKNSGLK